MSQGLQHLFESFELFDDEKLMKGFIRVARLKLGDSERLLNSPDYGFEQPFDTRFGKIMVKTGSHLLGVFGEVVFGLVHGTEILVLLAGVEDAGNPADGRDLICRFSSEASGKMTLSLGEPVTFQVKLYEFPAPEVAKKFFIWRQEANRAYALDRYFKFALLANGTDLVKIPQMLEEFKEAEKIEVLKEQEVFFAKVPEWQTKGVGLYWQAGLDDSEPSLMVELAVPFKEDFDKYLGRFI